MINNGTRISTVRKFIKRMLITNHNYCGVYGIRVETVSGDLVDRFISKADKVHYFQSKIEFENYKHKLEFDLYPDKLVDIHQVVNSTYAVKELQEI